jgi:hypothetical protein
MSRDKTHSRGVMSGRAAPLRIIAHACGWLFTIASIALMIGGMSGLELLAHSWTTNNLREVMTHILISGLVWGLLSMGWEAMRRPRARNLLSAMRGTAITETLIVLLPFMLLTSGLAQMTINNMAGMLTNKAAYEAGRTMWVWEPTDASQGQSRAHLAAAAAVAPVAPGSHMMLANSNAELQAMRGIMYATFSPVGWIGGGSGVSKSLATGSSVGGKSSTSGLSFTDALDDDAFPRRAARKLNFAYLATKVEPIRGNKVGAKVTYKHFQAFPWFGWITGRKEFLGPGMRSGYYSSIVRTYTLPAQVR